MNSLDSFLSEAKKGRYALGHFNFSTADVLRAIILGAKEAGAPAVMVGTSEGEADFIGMEEAVALVGAFREDFGFPVFLNADHIKSFEKCKEAIDAGYDSVLIDASRLPFDENVALTKRVWEYAKTAKGDVSVEGELGYLKGSSEVQKAVKISVDDYTKPEEAADFVARTNVDRLAVVFGNIHGIVKEVIHMEAAPTPKGVGAPTEASGKEHLDIEHLKKIAAALPAQAGVPDTHLILHGASGLADKEVSAAIKAGIVNVHFNTELRVAYAKELDKELDKEPLETTPYKYLAPAAEEVQKLVAGKVKLFMW